MIRALNCLSLVLIAGLAACSDRPLPASVTEVFKHDGSVQCDGGGVSVDEMAGELTSAGIDVFCSQQAYDGLAYCAACGCGTGRINVYTIDSRDLTDAESLGFKAVDPATYQGERCE